MRRALAIIGQLALIGAAGCANSCQAGDVARPPASTTPAPGNVARGATEPAQTADPGIGRAGTTPGIANDQLDDRIGTEPNIVVDPSPDRIGGTPGVANDQLREQPNVITDPDDPRLGTTPGIANGQLRGRVGTEPNVAEDLRLRRQQGVNPLDLQQIVPGTIAGPYFGYRIVPAPVPRAAEDEPDRSNYYIVESGGREWAVSEQAVEEADLYTDEGE